MAEGSVSRRKFLGYAVTAIVCGVIAGVGGYYAGLLAVPPPAPPKTVTTTVTAPTAPPKTVTTTVTAPPTTVTTTTTVKIREKPRRDKIVIGSSISQTGVFAAMGKETEWTYRRCINIINQQGGLYLWRYDTKFPIDYIVYNDESEPEKATANVERLCTVDEVDGLLGSFASPIQVSQGRAAQKNETPWIGWGSTHTIYDEQGWKWTFLIFGDNWASVDPHLIHWQSLPKEMRPKTMALWIDQSPMPIGTAKFWKEAAPEFGIKIIYEAPYVAGTKDFTDIIMATKKADPDAVWSIPIPPDGVTILKQCRELRYAPRWMIMHRAWDSATSSVPNAELNEYVTKHLPGGIPVKYAKGPYGAEGLVEDFEKEWGYPALFNVGNAHTCAQVLFSAMERAGTMEKEAVRKEMALTDMETASGHITFPFGYGHANITACVSQLRGGLDVIVHAIKPFTHRLWYYLKPKVQEQYIEAETIYPYPPWEKR